MCRSVSTLFVVVFLASSLNAQAQIGRKVGKLGQPKPDVAGQGGLPPQFGAAPQGGMPPQIGFAPPANPPGPGFFEDRGPNLGGGGFLEDRGPNLGARRRPAVPMPAPTSREEVDPSLSSKNMRRTTRTLRVIVGLIVLACGGIGAGYRRMS